MFVTDYHKLDLWGLHVDDELDEMEFEGSTDMDFQTTTEKYIDEIDMLSSTRMDFRHSTGSESKCEGAFYPIMLYNAILRFSTYSALVSV